MAHTAGRYDDMTDMNDDMTDINDDITDTACTDNQDLYDITFPGVIPYLRMKWIL